MSSVMTPTRLKKRVDEWREAREKKMASRLQLNADKKRTVSAMVLGVLERKPVQLPTPPSVKSTDNLGRPSIGLMKKSLSYGDVHNFQQRRCSIYPHDYRNRQPGLNSQETRSPYSYQQAPPKSPYNYNSESYRGANFPRSEPRKSFAASSSGYRAGYGGPSAGHRNQHQNQTPNSSYKGIRKNTNQSHRQGPGPSSEHPKDELGKSLKEKVVTFEDEIKDMVISNSELNPELAEMGAGGSDAIASAELETALNSTFTLDDGGSTIEDANNTENEHPSTGLKESDDKDQGIQTRGDLIIGQNPVILSQEDIPETEILCNLTFNGEESTIPEIVTEENVHPIHQEFVETKFDPLSVCKTEVMANFPEGSEVVLTKYDDGNSETDDDNFSLCLEADSSPMAEIQSEPLEVENHERVIINNDVYYPLQKEDSELVPSVTVELADPLAENDPTPTSELIHNEELPSIVLNPQSANTFEEIEKEKFAAATPRKGDQDSDDRPEEQKQGLITPKPNKNVTILSSQKDNLDEITENLDVMFITPGKGSRKSRVLLDSTNIVESSTIKYVIREMKQKETNDKTPVITPVRRSTRKKAETPGSLKSCRVIQELSPEVLQIAKVVQNPYLKPE